MNSRKLKIETVKAIAGMIDAGINTRYIALNTGLSWHTIHNLDASNPKNPKTCEAVEKFVENKSFHIAKNNIIKSFNTMPSSSGFLLEFDGFSMWEVNKIKRK